jgi:hypothetical protein
MLWRNLARSENYFVLNGICSGVATFYYISERECLQHGLHMQIILLELFLRRDFTTYILVHNCTQTEYMLLTLSADYIFVGLVFNYVKAGFSVTD